MSAVIQNEYTQNDNSTVLRSFTFPYLKTSDIKVSLDGVETTAFTLPNATTIQLNSVPPQNTKIKIFRQTSVDDLTATFYAGSAIKSEDLNDNFTQNLYKTQEVGARFVSKLGSTMTGDLTMGAGTDIVFEGATDDAHETTLTVADPTADRTITIPNVTGTVVTTGDTGTVATAMVADNAITTGKVLDGAITNPKLAADSVSTVKISNSAVNTAKIADSAVTTDKIAGNSVTEAKIADNSVGSSELRDNAVDTAAIQNDAVTNAKIADNSIDSEHYVDGSIDNAHLAGSSISQSKMAADSVGTAQLIDGSVDTARLAENSVTLAKMADNSVGTSELVDAAVTTAKIADGAITHNKLGTSIVTSQNIVDGTIATGDIANGAVTTDKLHTASVTGAKIADGTINSAELATGAVTADKISTNAVTTDKIADAELTTLAGMQSGTASKLADSTALTADIADLNQIDGLTKQTTISDSDASFPTSGAVVDYVAAQIAPLGGLEVIATEVAFPNTQPQAGVVISISDAGGVVFNGSGVSTTGRTVGGSTVTINNAPSSLHNETLVAGVGLMVSSTGSGQVYNYHKILGKEDDIKQLSDDINDFNARYRVGSSNPTSALDAGDLFFNTSTSKLLVYNATNTAWEEAQSIGNFFISTLSPAFNGSAQDFTITNAPTNAEQIILSINGVIQKPNSGTSTPSEGFALSGSTLKLSAAPASGTPYFAIVLGSTVNIGTPSNNTVSTAVLQNSSVTSGKILDGAVVNSKLAAGSVTTNKIADDAINAAKIADDAVTAAKIADNAINSTSMISGALIGTGQITNSAVTGIKIADGTIGSSKLESGVIDLSNDTSPQLGGNLDMNGNFINGQLENRQNSTDTDFTNQSNPSAASGITSQNVQGAFNTFNALTLVSHSGNAVGMSGSFVVKNHSGSGYSPSIFITQRDGSNSQRILQEMTNAGACKLNHGGNPKLETTSSGVTISGDNSTGSVVKGVTRFCPNDSTTVKAMWDETGFSGAGHLQVKDGVAFTAGNSSDLKIYHNGSNSYIDSEVGSLYIRDTGGVAKIVVNGYGTTFSNTTDNAAMTDCITLTRRGYELSGYGTRVQAMGGSADSQNGIQFAHSHTNGAGYTVRQRFDHDGIKFNGDTSVDNALDDYEEGTFTFSFSGGISITNNEMAYTKIGRFVMCTGRLTFASSGSNTIINMDGLPFTPKSLGNSAQGGVIPEHTRGSDGPFFMAVESSSNKVRIRNGASQTQSIANMSGQSIRFQLTYMAA